MFKIICCKSVQRMEVIFLLFLIPPNYTFNFYLFLSHCSISEDLIVNKQMFSVFCVHLSLHGSQFPGLGMTFSFLLPAPCQSPASKSFFVDLPRFFSLMKSQFYHEVFSDKPTVWNENGHPRIFGGQRLCLVLPGPAWCLTRGAGSVFSKTNGASLFFTVQPLCCTTN